MAKIQGKVTFDYEKCKGCVLCVNFCPVNILSLDKNTINKSGYNIIQVSDMSKCIACSQCAIMCPDSVITVEVLEHAQSSNEGK